MKRVIILVGALTLGVALTAQALPSKAERAKKSRQPRTVRSEAGLNMPDWGLAIDAFFDSRLTDLVPGYHIVNIVLTNRRDKPILLDPREDRWIIVDNAGKKHTARNHVRQLGGDTWQQLPEELRKRLDYPVSIKPGKFVTVDVFLPDSIDLENFREIVWKSDHFNKEFNVFTNVEGQINLADENENGLSLPSNPAPYTDDDYLKSREEILNPSRHSRPDRWTTEDEERERKRLEDSGINFDPSFDDAIIIR